MGDTYAVAGFIARKLVARMDERANASEYIGEIVTFHPLVACYCSDGPVDGSLDNKRPDDQMLEEGTSAWMNSWPYSSFSECS